MSNINRDTTDPIRLILRSDLKKHFLVYLDQQDNLLLRQWPEAEVMVFGSTLMRKLIDTKDVSFPFHGRKASDVDISLRTRTYMEPNTYERMFRQIMPDLISSAVKQNHFDIEIPLNGNASETYRVRHTDIPTFFSEPGNKNKLADEFIISRDYTKSEAAKILKQNHRHDLLPQLEAMTGEAIYADSIISIQNAPPQALLNSSNFIPDRGSMEGRIDLKRDNRLNLLTSKIVRAFNNKEVKPTDFVDIYNLLNASPQLFDLNPDSKQNYYGHIRCLIVAHMAANGIHDLNDISSNLMHNFQVTEANVDRFMNNYERVISSDQPISRENAKMFIKTARDLVFRSFGNFGENVNARLEDFFSLNEKNFLASQQGYQIIPGGYTKSRNGNFDIDVGLLKQEHTGTFEKYPELEHHIKNFYKIVERTRASNDRFDVTMEF